jgi:hypothetical protein
MILFQVLYMLAADQQVKGNLGVISERAKSELLSMARVHRNVKK